MWNSDFRIVLLAKFTWSTEENRNGYPVLGLTLMLGAVGVPFPSALSVVVAGSLAAQGQMSLLWAGAVAVAFSVLGDLAGYGLGRVLGREFFERRGRWLGLTPALRAKVETFFYKWGILTVVLSRSLLSFKSSKPRDPHDR